MQKMFDRFKINLEFTFMIKIAVTGANGFVGSRLVSKLRNNGYDVSCLVRTGANIDLLDSEDKIEYIDYNNTEELSRITLDCDVIIHNAGITRAKNWMQYQQVNVGLTANLLKLVNKNSKVKQFIFTSSQAASGPADDQSSPKHESDKNTPVTMYGKSKLMAERIIRKNCRKPFTIIRPVSVYGEGDKDFLQYFKLVKSKLAVKIGFKQKFLSLIYVEQLVEMISKTVLNKKAENETFFAVGTQKCSMTEFISHIESIIGNKAFKLIIPNVLLYPSALVSEIVSIFTRKVTILNRDKINEFKECYWLASAEKSTRLLKYTPENDLKTNLSKTYNWYKEKDWI
jgi:nucleoside-diphosphate-sugar epimerase